MKAGSTEVTSPLVALCRCRVGFGQTNGLILGWISHGLALTLSDDQFPLPNRAAILNPPQGMLSTSSRHAVSQTQS